MTAVLKSGQGPVHTLALARAPVPANRDRQEALVEKLRAELGRLREQLKAAAAQAEHSEADAYARGMAAGLEQAEDCAEARCSELKSGIEAARAEWRERLDALDCLAPALTNAALAKLLDAPGDWTEIVEAMLARQLRALRDASVLAIEVSPDDFSDAAVPDVPGVEVCLNPELRAGACRIACKLGEVELDARTQWRMLASLLEEMAA